MQRFARVHIVWEHPFVYRFRPFSFKERLHARWHDDFPHACACFGFTDGDAVSSASAYGSPYAQRSVIEVDIVPLDTAYLTSAKSCHDLHVEEVMPIRLVLDDFHKFVELCIVKHLLLGIGFLRDGSTFCWIADDKPFLDCHLQGFVEHEVDSSDHAVRQLISVQRMGLHSTFLFDLTVEFLNIRCGEGCEWLVTEEAFHLMLYL